MAENWDLNAVVRSCTTATETQSSITTTTADNGNLGDLTFDEDDDPFCFPNLEHPINNGFDELHQFHSPFNVSPSISICVESKPQQQAAQPQNHHHQQVVVVAGTTSSSLQLAPMQTQASRSRKRKNQQKRTVIHVTEENLCADEWAWRKYGQKPIKGSPNPRNYYRCSSSKLCSARKQVEQSSEDSNVFIVTLAGEHIHPRPTHRNSLAGSTRNKLSTSNTNVPANQKSEPNSHENDDLLISNI